MTAVTRIILSTTLLLFLVPFSFAQRGDPISLKPVTVAQGLERPWGLAFLPDGSLLVTEKEGRLRNVSQSGKVSAPIRGVPKVYSGGQGGLLDVVLAPDFVKSARIYFSYSEPEGTLAGTAVATGRLTEEELQDFQVIFRQTPKVNGPNHWGSRLVFDRTGMLFVTLGDRYAHREKAQDLSSHIGKIVRITPDGKIPMDNPFRNQKGAAPEIWSYGHRNVQGAALHPETGELWTHEHGARGGDEINIAQAGKNYGWPVITYGVDYSGAKIGIGTHMDGMEQPLHYWDPSIAPSGMTFYSGKKIPEWKGNLFVGALRGASLRRLVLSDTKVKREEVLLGDLGERIRTVKEGPDGWLYILTDSSNGRILRLEAPQTGL